MRCAIALILAATLLALTSCEVAANNKNSLLSNIPIRTSSDGFRYKVVIVEGRTFIAYQTVYGLWNLAGPIDK